MAELVRLELRDSVAVVVLDDPSKRNALSLEMHDQLVAVLDGLSVRQDVHAVVLCGAGGHFCSGADVSGMGGRRTVPALRQRIASFQRLVRLLAAFPKPVVAAVEGYAAGAGLSMVCLADAVVAAPTARFLASFVKVGLIPDMGLLSTLPQRIGLPAARRMMMAASAVGPEEALRLGLADQAAGGEDLLPVACALAASLGAHAPLPLAVMKGIYSRGIPSLEDILASEIDNQSALLESADHREGVSAFREKRAARFSGA